MYPSCTSLVPVPQHVISCAILMVGQQSRMIDTLNITNSQKDVMTHLEFCNRYLGIWEKIRVLGDFWALDYANHMSTLANHTKKI